MSLKTQLMPQPVEMPWKKEGIATRQLADSLENLVPVEMPWKKEGIATARNSCL